MSIRPFFQIEQLSAMLTEPEMLDVRAVTKLEDAPPHVPKFFRARCAMVQHTCCDAASTAMVLLTHRTRVGPRSIIGTLPRE